MAPSRQRETGLMMEAATGDGIINLGVGVLSAALIIAGFFVQRSFIRQDERGHLYADALRALDDYLEAPYRVRRRDGSAEARMALTQQISDVQVRLSYVEAAMTQLAPARVAERFTIAQAAARREAGKAMTEAWNSAPTRRDRAVPLRARIVMLESEKARTRLVEAMAPGARMIHTALWTLLLVGVLCPTILLLIARVGPPAIVALVPVLGIVAAAVVAAVVLPVLRLGRRRVAGVTLLASTGVVLGGIGWASHVFELLPAS